MKNGKSTPMKQALTNDKRPELYGSLQDRRRCEIAEDGTVTRTLLQKAIKTACDKFNIQRNTERNIWKSTNKNNSENCVLKSFG